MVTWRLEANTDKDMIKILVDINNNNVEENLTQNTIGCNKCRGNPPNHNHMYYIAGTGAKKKTQNSTLHAQTK